MLVKRVTGFGVGMGALTKMPVMGARFLIKYSDAFTTEAKRRTLQLPQGKRLAVPLTPYFTLHLRTIPDFCGS